MQINLGVFPKGIVTILIFSIILNACVSTSGITTQIPFKEVKVDNNKFEFLATKTSSDVNLTLSQVFIKECEKWGDDISLVNIIQQTRITSFLFIFRSEEKFYIYDVIRNVNEKRPITAIDKNNKRMEIRSIDKSENTKSTSDPILVYEKPVAKISLNNALQCFEAQSFDFSSNLSTVGSGFEIIDYNWTFDIGYSAPSTNTKNVKGVRWDKPGIKNVILKITDANGSQDTYSMTVNIKQNPKALWTTKNYIQCLDVNKYDFSSSLSQPASSYQSFTWDFDIPTEMININSPSPSGIKYTSSGLKTVVLKITDKNGCSDTFLNTILIKDNPKANFTISNSNCFVGSSFNFISNSLSVKGSNIKSYSWDFGANSNLTNSSSSSISEIKYNSVGTSLVSLVVVDNNGCPDTIKKNVESREVSKFLFEHNKTKDLYFAHPNFTEDAAKNQVTIEGAISEINIKYQTDSKSFLPNIEELYLLYNDEKFRSLNFPIGTYWSSDIDYENFKVLNFNTGKVELKSKKDTAYFIPMYICY